MAILFRRAVIAVLTFLSVVSAVLWVWSYAGSYTRRSKVPTSAPPRQGWRCDLARAGMPASLIARAGRLTFSYNEEVQRMMSPSPPKVIDVNLWAIRFHVQRYPSDTSGGGLIHFWLLTALLAAYPIVALIRGPVRRAMRRAKNRCIHCGYDLTGNTCGACTECGQSVSKALHDR